MLSVSSGARELSPYPVYRGSGLPWLSCVPEHWEIRRNGRLFAQRNETGYPDLPILEVSLKTGVRVRDLDNQKRKQIMADHAKYKRAAKGDIAYNMMRLWQGAVGVVPVDGLVSPAYVVAKPYPEVESRYYAYLFRTTAYMNEVNKYSRGIVSDRNRLYWDEFKQMPSLFPPREEQRAIADYLDGQALLTIRFIRNKRRQIELLNELKSVACCLAATRGLDPSLPLKRSGYDWLQDVPAPWDVAPLGRFAARRCDGPFGSGLKSSHYVAHGIRVVRLQNIGFAQFLNTDAAFISQEHYASLGDHGVVGGDLLVAGLGDERIPAGRACVAPPDLGPAMVKADCFRFRLRTERVLPEFVALQLSATARDASAALSTGATRQRVNLLATASRAIAVPPLSEQVQIINQVTQMLAPLDAAIGTVQRELDRIREYRTRMIADVVSGKLDVRHLAASGGPQAEDLNPSEVEAEAADEDELETAEEVAVGEE